MAKEYKPSYRHQKAKLGTSVKIIIILLVLIVITLSAFLIKLVSEKLLDPGIVYPTDGGTSASDKADGPSSDTSAGTDVNDRENTVRSADPSAYDVKSGPLVLVNRSVPYNTSEPEGLVVLYDVNHDNFTLSNISERLCDEAYNALCRMTDAYADRNGYCPIMVTSAYRDEEQQRKYYDDYVENESDKDYVELPGYSDHHTGYGFDVKIYDKNGASYSYGRYASDMVEWITENYQNYGFIMRYPANKGGITGIGGESNHFRYVGVPHSVYIAEKGLCLEEYLELLRSHSYKDPLKITTDTDSYLVWYCQKDGLFLPNDADYSVSGDNMNGFIVTVRER